MSYNVLVWNILDLGHITMIGREKIYFFVTLVFRWGGGGVYTIEIGVETHCDKRLRFSWFDLKVHLFSPLLRQTRD